VAQKTQTFTQFIALTGLVDIETAVELMREGAQDYLIKPMRKQNLLIVVDKALKHCRLLRENRRLEEENRRYQSGLERMVEEKTRTLCRPCFVMPTASTCSVALNRQ
jgi:FixJ family two-component response regulator